MRKAFLLCSVLFLFTLPIFSQSGHVAMINQKEGSVLIQIEGVKVGDTLCVLREKGKPVKIRVEECLGAIGCIAKVIPPADLSAIRIGDKVIRAGEKVEKEKDTRTLSDVKKILPVIQARLQKCKDYQGKISLLFFQEGMETKIQSSVWFKQPDKYRLEMDMGSEGKMTMVMEGNRMTQEIKRAGKSMYMKWDMEKTKSLGLSSQEEFLPLSPAELLKSLEKSSQLRLRGEENLIGRNCWVLEGKAEEGGIKKSFRWWMDKEYGLPLKMEDYDEQGKLIQQTAFVEIKINSGVSPSVFSLNIPEGAEVIDLAKLMEEYPSVPKNLKEVRESIKIPPPPEKSLLVSNFAGKGIETGICYGFSRMLALHLHYASHELMYQPTDSRFSQVLKEDGYEKTYAPSRAENKGFGKRMGIRYILGGEIEKDGKSIVLRAYLLDRVSGKEDKFVFKGPLKELPSLGSKLSLEVAQKIGVEVTPEIEKWLARPLTASWKEFEIVSGTFVSDNDEKDIKILKKALRKFPRSYQVYMQLILKTVDTQKYEECVTLCDKMLKIFPAHSRIRLIRATSLTHLPKRAEEGIKELVKLTREEPQYIYPYMNLSCIFKELGRDQEAVEWGKKAVAVNPASAEARLLLARTYFAMGLNARAGAFPKYLSPEKRKLFSLGVTKAKEEAEYAIAIDPRYYCAYGFLIKAYRENGLTHLGEEAFEIAHRGHPEMIINYARLADLYRFGYDYNPQKQYAALERAIKENPDNPWGYFFYVDTLYREISIKKRGEPIKIDIQEHKKKIKELNSKGYKVMEKKIKEHPDEVDNYRYYAERILRDLEREKKDGIGVIDTYSQTRKMVEIAEAGARVSNFKDKTLLRLAAEGYTWTMDFHKAIDLSQKALKIDPDYYEALQTIVDAYCSLRNFGPALPFIKRMIELKPLEGLPYARLGFANQSLGLRKTLPVYQTAIAKLNQEIERDPYAKNPYLLLSYVYTTMGDRKKAQEVYKRAIKALEERIKKDSEELFPYRGMGFFYEKLGNRKKAIEYYRKALRLDPYDYYVKKRLEELTKK
ncbi:MAG: tetratricopeptide repeat protein [Caldiserica bacterium]|nr:tetratricopeptide repeat protein [Caldisericota bacterium]